MEQNFCDSCLNPLIFNGTLKSDIDECYSFWYCEECELTYKYNICCDDISYGDELDYSEWDMI